MSQIFAVNIAFKILFDLRELHKCKTVNRKTISLFCKEINLLEKHSLMYTNRPEILQNF